MPINFVILYKFCRARRRYLTDDELYRILHDEDSETEPTELENEDISETDEEVVAFSGHDSESEIELLADCSNTEDFPNDPGTSLMSSNDNFIGKDKSKVIDFCLTFLLNFVNKFLYLKRQMLFNY